MTTIKRKDELDEIIDDLVDLKDELSEKIEELENLEVDKLEDIDNEDLAEMLKDRMLGETVIVTNLNMSQYDKLIEFIHTEIYPIYSDQVKHIL